MKPTSRNLSILAALAAVCPVAAFADNVNVSGNIRTTGGNIVADVGNATIAGNINSSGGSVRAQTYFTTPGYILVNGSGSSIYSLTIPQWLTVGTSLAVGTDKLVVASDGTITMSKVQGDIAMGQFGNP